MHWKYQALSILVAVFVLAAISAAQEGQPQSSVFVTLFDGKQPKYRGNWGNVNDNVMGGVSTGRYGFTPEGELRFFGSLSLANNGGFASVRSLGRQPMGIQQDDELWLRIRGDGRKYNLDLRVPSRRMAFTYRVSMQTVANQWQEFRVPLSLFRATSFGRVVANAGLVNASSVNSVGFTVSDKKQGPFQLDVDWIRTVKSDKRK